MAEVIDLSGSRLSNAPAIPDSERIQEGNDANIALIVKINEACEKECRLRARLNHTCGQSWLGKLYFVYHHIPF